MSINYRMAPQQRRLSLFPWRQRDGEVDDLAPKICAIEAMSRHSHHPKLYLDSPNTGGLGSYVYVASSFGSDFAMSIINPALHRFPKEAAILGRLVLAWGELEYMLILSTTQALKDNFHFLKAMYRLRSTVSRIQSADVFLRATYSAYCMDDEYATSLGALRHCLKIRNQYSHCNWADDHKEGLFFADLEESATATAGFIHHWNHIDLALLERQEAYFVYAQSWLYWLNDELTTRRKETPENLFPKPPGLAQPPLHNLRSQHIPPWLTSDLKLQHLERAQAVETSTPQRERPPSTLRLTEDEWLARYRKEGRSPETGAE